MNNANAAAEKPAARIESFMVRRAREMRAKYAPTAAQTADVNDCIVRAVAMVLDGTGPKRHPNGGIANR